MFGHEQTAATLVERANHLFRSAPPNAVPAGGTLARDHFADATMGCVQLAGLPCGCTAASRPTPVVNIDTG
jgi:hypothetical protein